MNGTEIAQALIDWANKKGMHQNDFDDLFVHELMDELEKDDDHDRKA